MEITFKLPPPLADSLVPFEVPEDQMDVFTILRLKETAAEISELNVEAVRLVTSQGKHLAPDDMLIEEFFSEQQQKTGVTIHIVKKSGGGGGVGAGSPRSAEITPAALKAVSSPSHGPSIPDGLLENPMIKSLMENPEFINSMIQSSPQLKNLTENNPEAKRMLTDPAFMSQMRNTMKNPKLMQEMMRNHDRQLQNIEALPGGFNYLSQHFKDHDAPLLDIPDPASSSSATANTSSPTSSANSSGSPNTQALPNPWATPQQRLQQQQQQQPFVNPFAIPGLGSGSGSGAASDGGGMGNMNSLLGILGSLNNGGPSSGVPANPFLPASSSSTTAAATQQQQGMSDLLRALIIQRQLQQAAGGGGVGGGVNPFPNPFATLPINPFLPSSSSLSSSLAASATAPPPIDAEERYSNQLQSMAEMGFTEREKNLRALIATGGDLEAAINYLFNM